MTTLAGWRTSAANLLVEAIPLQTFDSSVLLIDAYLASVGGWVPDDVGDPTGEGSPVNGDTPEEAVAAIVEQQLDRMYRLDATLQVELTLQFVSNLAPGQSDEDVRSQMQPLIEALLEVEFGSSLLNFSNFTNLSGPIITGGTLDAVQRVEIQGLIATASFAHDPRAVAVNAARNIYALDDLWNVENYYTEVNQPIVTIIRKYTTLTYVTIDTAETLRYVIGVNRDTYVIESGIKTSISS